jgi:hypothetical protein
LAGIAEEIWERRRDIRERVRFYFHYYTRNDLDMENHPATVAAMDQGMAHFWALHDLILDGLVAEPPVVYTVDELADYADKTLKLDMIRFNEVLESEETLQFLAWEKNQLADAGYEGTPTLLICGDKVSPWPDLENAIDEHLENL